MEHAEHRTGIKWIGISSTTDVMVPTTATTLRAHPLESAVVRVRTRQPRNALLTPLYPLTLENGSHHYSIIANTPGCRHLAQVCEGPSPTWRALTCGWWGSYSRRSDKALGGTRAN